LVEQQLYNFFSAAGLLARLNGIHASMPLLKQTENSLCFSTSSSAATFGTPGMATYDANDPEALRDQLIGK
jgi:hypothetical protein